MGDENSPAAPDQQPQPDPGLEQKIQQQAERQHDGDRGRDANRGGGPEGSQANQADQGGTDRH